MRTISRGTVYLVGAGPGDPGLLTVRALELIRHADVVLHDHLVSAEILAESGVRANNARRRCYGASAVAVAEAEVRRRGPASEDVGGSGGAKPPGFTIDVGKVGHGPQADQAVIQRYLIAFARAGHSVVRLKGGDPFVFGRGAEEALALRRANVPFEIVPGVSSALAAPAYAGIPLTARGVAASIAIVSGHCARACTSLPKTPLADTIVVLMGISNAAAIRNQVMAAGRSGDTPVAVIEWATHAQQRVEIATLATLTDAIARAGIRAPAVIVIGDTVNLRPALDWLGIQPAKGSRGTKVTESRLTKGLDEHQIGVGALETCVEKPPAIRTDRKTRCVNSGDDPRTSWTR